MNSLQLENALKFNYITKPWFGGIYTNDEYTNVPYNTAKYYIFNTVAPPETMGHWILFCFYQNILFFIDSLAGNPILYGGVISRYFEQYNGRKKILITNQIQPNVSVLCGAYCFFFAYKICSGKSPEKTLKSFSFNNLLRNDFRVEQFFYKKNNAVGTCRDLVCPHHMFFDDHCKVKCICSYKPSQ